MVVFGIDPGVKGAIAVLDEDTAMAYPFSWDTYRDVIREERLFRDVVAVVEDVHSMPKQGVASTFAFGQSKGMILGMLFQEGIKTVLVSPQKWKKHFGLGKDKQESIDLCKKLYPQVALLPTPRCKKDSDGMAEALLIARWYLDTL